MSECKVKLNEQKPAKKQALDIIKDLEKVIPIKRAQMRIVVSFENSEQSEAFKSSLTQHFDGDFTIEKII